MSRFSGKCDLYDHLTMFDEDGLTPYETFLKREVKLFWADQLGLDKDKRELVYPKENETIPISKPSDLVPLYPHVITMMMSSEGKDVIYIMNKSWVDLEAERYGDTFGVRQYYRQELAEELERVKKEEDPKW